MDNGLLNKGCLYQGAFVIVAVVLIIWVIVGISSFSTYPLVLATALVPLGSLILSLYKQRTGGLLIILSGVLLIIIIPNIPSVKADDFYVIGLMIIIILAALPLCVAGIMISIAPSKKTLEPLKRGRKYTFDGGGIKGKVGWFCDECDAKVYETDKFCPKCGVEFE